MTASLDKLRGLLSADEVLEQGSSEYNLQAKPWSVHADQHPQLVVTPKSLDTLSKIVKYLYESELDFAVRNTGTGSVSARDVILSTHGFKSFDYDKTGNTLTIGAGLDWGEVDRWMTENVPGHSVVGARCSWVGVTGSALVGGLSWLSHEFGMISDPQNLLDVQVCQKDGTVIWASEQPDLLWALRGGGGNFVVVTALKLQARPYPTKIFSGVVSVPYSSLKEASKVVADVAARTADPRLAMHVVNLGPGMGFPNPGAKPDVGFMLYDANGAEHAMSEKGFKQILDIPGAQNFGTQELNLQQVNAIAETFRDYQGTSHFWLSAPLIEKVDDETLIRAWKWYERSVDACAGFGSNSTVLLEFMQEQAFNSSGSRTATAWPHSGRRHVMQLVLGCKQEEAPANLKEITMKRLTHADTEIAGPGNETREFHAGFLHEWNDLRQVYGENYDKLREIKKKYDPENRFNKSIDFAEGRVQSNATV
ncbi:FAD-binding domain-containing protein 55 [Elsinoe fawcettii]|nr:FAD-binding domain-containing protein 55 [Elsinoe fawcettii]